MQRIAVLLLVLAPAIPTVAQPTPTNFVNFESSQTHPIAVSLDGERLFAVNTADNRLSVFSLARADKPVLIDEIPVGLEPVSVCPADADRIWVVNRLGDSVSVVSLSQRQVVATIPAKDEPADVVFGGSPRVAFVSVAASDAVRVFDIDTYQLLADVPLFGDEPRALAVSADGNTVFAAIHRSGNRTTVVDDSAAPAPPPPTNPSLPAAPKQGILVDSTDPQWSAVHGITLPDYDVFEIDVATRVVQRTYSGLGTTLFDVVVHPQTGDLWVAATDARNLVRFQPNLRGHVVDSQLARLTPGASPNTAIVDLNPGIDYSVLPNSAALTTALAQPTGLAFSSTGDELWVAAFGTDRVAVVDGAGQVLDFVELGVAGSNTDPRNKRGPRGLAMHPSGAYLYVTNRLSNSLTVIDTASRTQLRELSIGYDPTPAFIADGRGFLYDAKLSGNGTAACAACHVDGELDGLAWDLGDPGGKITTLPAMMPTVPVTLIQEFHPMKGPMTTQTMRGLTDNVAPFHWRGDRPNLQSFNGTFDALLGRVELPSSDMDAFAEFLKTLAFPPNPNQNLDRTLAATPVGTSAQEGLSVFTNSAFFVQGLSCVDCHTLPEGTSGIVIPEQFVTATQAFKAGQLRNIYKRSKRQPVGGLSKSGFGLGHDGALDRVINRFMIFDFGVLSGQPNTMAKLENLMLSMDTGMAPSVGYSVTVTSQNSGIPTVAAALDLLEQEAGIPNCDLVARGEFRGQLHGFAYDAGSSQFVADAAALGTFTLAELRAEIQQGAARLTFMGVPVGSGARIGTDRDLDGLLDSDEMPQSYGQPTPPCAPPIHLRGNSQPRLGNSVFAVLAEGVPTLLPGAVLLSAQSGSVPFVDITLLIGLAQTIPVPVAADSTGLATVELPIPSVPTLSGQSVFAQAIFGVPCGMRGLAASDGLAITIGL